MARHRVPCSLRVETAGAAIYEARFDAAVRASLVLPGPGPLPGALRLRVPLPSG